jgi:hypothetical protein
LFASVIKNPWVTPEGTIYNFIRLEFKLNRGKNANPICVSFTPTQFEWLVHKIANKSESQLVPGEKEWKMVSYERPEHWDDNIIIGVIDRSAKFGIVLDVYEQSQIEFYSKILSFVMKNQSAKNEKLKDLMKIIYSSVLSDKMKVMAKDECKGCKDESLIHEDHSCSKISNEDELFEIYLRSMKSDGVGEKFIEFFDYYTELLNINELVAKEAKIMLFPLISADEKELFKFVKEAHCFVEQSSDVKCIQRLNNHKRLRDGANDELMSKRVCK